MATGLTNREKWAISLIHGIISAILLFNFILICEVQTKSEVIRVKQSFWGAWRIYGVTNIIILFFVFGVIMTFQKRRFFKKPNTLLWLWPLALILGTLFPFVFYIGKDHVVPLYFALWIRFTSFCLVFILINKVLQILHKKRYA